MTDETNDQYIMQLYSGKPMNVLHPRADDIDIVDIAHSLALVCRFGGHSKFHYSVAQHSILVACLLPPELQLAGLLHDAHEAYMGDVMTCVKRAQRHIFLDRKDPSVMAVDPLSELSGRLDQAICEKFELDIAQLMNPFLKHADLQVLAMEKRDVMGAATYEWMPLPRPLPYSITWLHTDTVQQRFAEAFDIVKSGGHLACL